MNIDIIFKIFILLNLNLPTYKKFTGKDGKKGVYGLIGLQAPPELIYQFIREVVFEQFNVVANEIRFGNSKGVSDIASVLKLKKNETCLKEVNIII